MHVCEILLGPLRNPNIFGNFVWKIGSFGHSQRGVTEGRRIVLRTKKDLD